MSLTASTRQGAPAKRSLLSGFDYHSLRLSPDIERRFQADYYTRILPGLRLVSLLLAGLVAGQILLNGQLAIKSNLIQLLFWLLVLGLTWAPSFSRVWQPTLVALGWLLAMLTLRGYGHAFARNAIRGVSGAVAPVFYAAHSGTGAIGATGPPIPQQEFAFMLQLAVLMVSLSTLRLSFRWNALLQSGVVAIGLWQLRTLPDPDLGKFLRFILLPGMIVLLVLLLASFAQERLARSAFLSAYQLEEERNGERRQKEQTQGKLQVLARAIGGIVHDLGGPMTVVMMGTDLLALEDSQDAESSNVVHIREAAQMLAALRVSLIEQTRILEGKPIPVDLRPVSLRSVVEAGARFQNSRLMYGRKVTLVGEDVEVRADHLKLATVFMNLISNALKYSDGEVRVVWHLVDDFVLVAVLDQGTNGKGISPAQSERLFAAFGRLEAHAEVEGTGLGLLSARKVVEAHGGEAFIEAHQDGMVASPLFATATSPFFADASSAFLTNHDFLTGFVVALPTI